jgi:integrase
MTVRKRKDSGTWIADFTIDGERFRLTIPTARNKSQALDAERVLMEQAHRRKYGLDVGARQAPLLKEFVTEYMAWAEGNKRSWKTDAYHCRVLVKHFGEKRLTEITPFDIEKFKIERLQIITPKGKPITKNAINRTLEVMCKMFTLAMNQEQWGVAKNPCRQVEKFTIEKRPYRILTKEEEERLFDHLVGRRKHLAYIVALNLHTGLRPSELVKLQVSDVDFANRRLKIEHTKTNTARFVPMNRNSEELLIELSQKAKEKQSPFLFPSPRDPQKPMARFNKAFAAAVKEAGLASDGYVQNITPYKLRHTFATRLAELTRGDAFTLQKVLGHANITTSRHYVHVQEEQVRRAIEALDDYGSSEQQEREKRSA